MTTLQNYEMDMLEVLILSKKSSQWRKIYSFVISINLTSHYQCVSVGWIVTWFLYFTMITLKSQTTKFNGLQFRQIWIINPIMSITLKHNRMNIPEYRFTKFNWLKLRKITQIKASWCAIYRVANHQWLQWLISVEWQFCESCRINASNPQVLHIQRNRVQFFSIPHNMNSWRRCFAFKTDIILQGSSIERWRNGRMITWGLEGVGVAEAKWLDSIIWQ